MRGLRSSFALLAACSALAGCVDNEKLMMQHPEYAAVRACYAAEEALVPVSDALMKAGLSHAFIPCSSVPGRNEIVTSLSYVPNDASAADQNRFKSQFADVCTTAKERFAKATADRMDVYGRRTGGSVTCSEEAAPNKLVSLDRERNMTFVFSF